MRSILGQTFTDFELVVSDHSSTDGTWEALQPFAADPRVRLSRLAPGGGGPANFNAVTDLATGEFIKLVCGDDLLSPDSLAEQVAALEARPAAVMAASPRDVIDAAGTPVLRNRGLAGLRGEVNGADAIRKTVLAGTNIFGEPASVLFRRSVLVDAGGWDGRFPYLIDQATYCAVLIRGNLVAVPRSLAAFRVSPSQWSVRLGARTGRAVHRLQPRVRSGTSRAAGSAPPAARCDESPCERLRSARRLPLAPPTRAD